MLNNCIQELYIPCHLKDSAFVAYSFCCLIQEIVQANDFFAAERNNSRTAIILCIVTMNK